MAPGSVSKSPSSDKKKKVRKVSIDGPEIEEFIEQKSKKEKKTKIPSDDSNIKKKEKRKRKDTEIDNVEEERSETSSEMGEPMNMNKKKMKLGDEETKNEEEENPNAVSNFRISKPLREALKAKGIESLFPIQAMTFDTVLDGVDLVGRARTGQGKTLAFVLPILESLTNGPTKASRKTGYGRTPSVLVLLPTRELATQVFSDFEFYGGALGLTSCCLYGGSPYQPQHVQLKRGVDVVIGTPGRIKDHIER